MKHPASQYLFAYWNDLRAGRAAPERSDIDPAAIRSILADTVMIEVEQAGRRRGATFTIRLSGTRVDALFTTGLKGRDLPSLWRLGDQPNIADLASAVLDETRPAVAGVTAGPVASRPISLELLLLPLRHKGKTHARILGVLSPATIPDWLGLRQVAPLSMTSHRFIETESPSRFGAKPGAWHAQDGTRRRHLVIYEGGRV